MTPTTTSADTVRKDIREYEYRKKLRRLGLAGAGVSALGAVASAAKGSKLVYPALGAAFISGLAAGHSKREGQYALNRIKRYYDLRPREGQEKVALWTTPADFISTLVGVAPVVGASLGMLTSALSKGKVSPLKGILGGAVAGTAAALGADAAGLDVSGMLGPGSSVIDAATDLVGGDKTLGSAVGLGADLAFIPHAANGVSSSTANLFHVAAKAKAGVPLTVDERVTKNIWGAVESSSKKVDAMKDGKIKSLINYAKVYFDPWIKAKTWGGRVGEGIKAVGDYAPTYGKLLLDATKGTPEAEKALQIRLTSDKNTFSMAGRMLDNSARKLGLKSMLSGSGEFGQKLIKDIAEDSGITIDIAKKVDQIAEGTLEAAKVLNQTVDNIPLGRYLLNKSVPSGGSIGEIGSQIWDDPEKIVQIAKKIDSTVSGVVRGGKAGLGAAGLAALGYSLGNYRSRHPLAENELPKEITDGIKERGAMSPLNNVTYLEPKPGKVVAV